MEWWPQWVAIIERVAIKRDSTVISFQCTEGMWNKSWSIEQKWTNQTNCLKYIKLRFLSALRDTIWKLLAPVSWSVICSTVSACVWVWVYYMYVYRDKACFESTRCSVPGKHPLPGKRPCTEFQGVTVAASIQTYGIYILGKHPHRSKLRVMFKRPWALTRDTTVCMLCLWTRCAAGCSEVDEFCQCLLWYEGSFKISRPESCTTDTWILHLSVWHRYMNCVKQYWQEYVMRVL